MVYMFIYPDIYCRMLFIIMETGYSSKQYITDIVLINVVCLNEKRIAIVKMTDHLSR